MTRPAIDAALERAHSPELHDALRTIQGLWNVVDAYEEHCNRPSDDGTCAHVSTLAIRGVLDPQEAA